MGGKDRMAIYLIGDENVHNNSSGFFYLDPHYVQNAVPSQELNRHFPASPVELTFPQPPS